MKKVGIFIVILAVIWAVPQLRSRVGAVALPVLEKLGPAADFIVDPIRGYSAKNKIAHTLRVIESDYNRGIQPPDPQAFHEWMRRRMPGESGLDPWGNAYWMRRGQGVLTVGSSGPDGTVNTDDDVTSESSF
ncbi:hypothetical protein BH23GEM10_BH23GEM10_14670 [soil metagenome]